MFEFHLFKKQNEVKRAKDCFGEIWMDVRGKGQLEPLCKASTEISVKTLKLSKIRSHPISADSMLKFCLSPVISYKHECSSGALESLLFILLYPGCVQSIHNRPVFLINHKRFLFCLQLVLGWLTMASQSSYIKHRPFLTLAFCWGMQFGASPPKRGRLGMRGPRQRRSLQICPLLRHLLFLSDAFLGQIRSRERSKVSKFRALLFYLSLLSPSLLTSSFIKSAQDHSISNRGTGHRVFFHIL